MRGAAQGWPSWPDRARNEAIVEKTKQQPVKTSAGRYEAGVPQDDTMRLIDLDGMASREGFLEVTSHGRRTLVTADVLCNQHGAKGIAKFLAAPTECLSVPRITRLLLMKDKAALKAHLERLVDPQLERIIVCHGDDILQNAHVELQAAAARL